MITVSTRKQFREFIQLPYRLHSGDANWVPPLKIMVKQSLDEKNNPFYQNAKRVLWIAYRGKQPIGRIAGILNARYIQFHHETTAFWGFFEVENNIETAKALFSAVEQWALTQSITSLRGPTNPSMNYECGLQISAFDTKPFVMMTQNPPYYATLLEALGYQKVKDMHAWVFERNNSIIAPSVLRYAEKLCHTNHISKHYLPPSVMLKNFEAFYALYNEVFEPSWGFTPMTKDEFYFICKELKSIMNPKSILFLKIDGEFAGYIIWLPNINQVLSRIKTGRLFPLGLLKLLWHTKINRKLVMEQGRIPLVGIRKKFRHLKLGPLLYMTLINDYVDTSWNQTECSWVLEDNKPMQTVLRLMNARKYKTYRIYEKTIHKFNNKTLSFLS